MCAAESSSYGDAFDGQPAYEFRDETVFDEIFRLHVAQRFPDVLAIVLRAHFRAEADAAFFRARTDDLVETVERTAADEQDIRRVDLHELLVRVLAAAVGGH